MGYNTNMPAIFPTGVIVPVLLGYKQLVSAWTKACSTGQSLYWYFKLSQKPVGRGSYCGEVTAVECEM